MGVESLGGGERKQERKSVESHAKQEQGEVQPEPPAQPDAGEQKTAPGLWISGARPETGDWRLHSWVMKQPAAGRCPPGTNRRRGNAQVLSVGSKVTLGVAEWRQADEGPITYS